jgi:hypothetical protein
MILSGKINDMIDEERTDSQLLTVLCYSNTHNLNHPIFYPPRNISSYNFRHKKGS